MPLLVGCIAGALQEEEYKAKLTAAGFAAIEIEPTRVYDVEDARAFLSGQGIGLDKSRRRWPQQSQSPSEKRVALDLPVRTEAATTDTRTRPPQAWLRCKREGFP